MTEPPRWSVPFLARMAPAARASTPGVRAALPSRFESTWPIEQHLEETIEQPEDAATRGKARAATSRPAPAANAPEQGAAPPAAEVGRERGPARPTEEAPARAPLRASDPEPAPRPARSPAHRDTSEDVPPVAGPRTRDAAAAAPLARQPLGSPRLHLAAELRPSGFAELARPAADVRPPLRESTVAQRAPLPRAEQQDVVHVTIDRLDLRSLREVPSERREAPRQRAAPTVPLGEYLRRRDDPRRGGGSP